MILTEQIDAAIKRRKKQNGGRKGRGNIEKIEESSSSSD